MSVVIKNDSYVTLTLTPRVNRDHPDLRIIGTPSVETLGPGEELVFTFLEPGVSYLLSWDDLSWGD